MMTKHVSALDVYELLDKLPTDRTDYREALRRRLLNGAISAYCAMSVVSDEEGNQQLPGASINARVWKHIFAQGGDDLIWPSQDMSTFFHEAGKVPCRCDYLGLYFLYKDLADFLPIDELLAESAPLIPDPVETPAAPRSIEPDEGPIKAVGRPSKSHLEAAAWVCVQVADLSAAELKRETLETIIERMSAAFVAMNETAAVDKANAMAILRGIRRARPR